MTPDHAVTSAPARINPDTRAALVLAMGATGLLVGVSFVLSYSGLSALAPWAAVPEDLAPLVPLFIDGAILVYTYSALAARARHEPTGRPWTWVAGWTAVSSLANAAHAWAYGPSGWQGVVGAVLAGLFPIGSLLGCHEIADRMIARPDTDPADSPLCAPAADAVRADTADGHAPDDRTDDVASADSPDGPTLADTGQSVRRVRASGRVADYRTDILAHYDAGMSGNKIAAELGLGKTAVYQLLSAEGRT